MNNVFNLLRTLCGFLCGVTTYVLGGLDTVLLVLVAMIVIDYITGIMVAIVKKQLSSRIGFNGIFKKVAILSIIASAHLLGKTIGIPDIRSIVIGFYIANEGISITENVGELGVPLPKKLVDILQQLKSKDDE